MHYRTIADLSDAITTNLHRLPRAVDLVVGIPRSGLLAGSMIALNLNVPLADVEGFLNGRILASGRTRRRDNLSITVAEAQNILVVDDSIISGGSSAEARRRLTEAYPTKTFHFCAVYGVKPHPPGGELVLEVVPSPRMFQWNIMHHPLLNLCCVDIDGVLCVDPLEEENDDGARYLDFLLNAQPLHLPTQQIGYLVTSRLEKYRSQTEAWLKSRGVEYRDLVMLDLPSKEERQRTSAHGTFKASVYKQMTDALLFIESDAGQAQRIMELSGKPVLSIETQQLLTPDPLSTLAAAQRLRTMPTRLRVNHWERIATAKRVARSILGETLYQRVKRTAGLSGS